MEVYLPGLLGNYEKHTNQQTAGVLGKLDFKRKNYLSSGVRRRASLEQERCQRRVVVVHRYMQRRYAVLPLCINRGFL